MAKICLTRFTDKTLSENTEWKIKNNISGCIYGTPVTIDSTIYPEEKLIIIEMNNSQNKIIGIGLIKNKLFNKRCNIYSDQNYNRYIYKSDYHITIDKLNIYQKQIIEVLEFLLFKGRSNYKRGHGIQQIPRYIKNLKNIDIVKFFNELHLLNNNK